MSDPHWIGARYELLEQLGGGAEGQVWRGWDLVTGADCVARSVHLDSAGPNGLTAAARWSQLVRTVETVARLAHPGLVTVDDIVADEGRWVLVTRLVPGETLQARLARAGVLPVAEATRLVAQLCDALAVAHDAGLAHGRVKPSNLLLEPSADGAVTVRVTDFGVAALECWAAHHAALDPAATLARVQHRPPEWIPGMPITAAGDIYAIGVLLYEALTGRLPFESAAPDQSVRRHGEPSLRPPEVSDALWALLTQCLNKRPRLRPTAAQVASRLRETMPGPPVPIRSVNVVRRGGAHVRRAPDAALPDKRTGHRREIKALRRVEFAASATAVALVGSLTITLGGHAAPPPRTVPTRLATTRSAASGSAQQNSNSPSALASFPFATPGQGAVTVGATAPTTIGAPITTGTGAPLASAPVTMPSSIPPASPVTAPSTPVNAPRGGLPVSDPIGYLEQLRAMIQQLANQGPTVIDANAAGDLENLVLDLENGVDSYEQNGGQGLLQMIKDKISGFNLRLAQLQSRGLIAVGAAGRLAAFLQQLSPA